MRGNTRIGLLFCGISLHRCGPAGPGPAGGLSSGRNLRFAPGRPGCLLGRRGPASGLDRPAIDDRGADHAAKHLGRSAGPISAGASGVLWPGPAPGLQRSHAGRCLCLSAADLRGGPGSITARRARFPRTPVFQPWPRVPNDIWGTPYYGYVRQPIGHIKIWTGRLSYIYKPIYASPPMETARPTASPPGAVPLSLRPPSGSARPAPDVSSPAESLNVPPPPRPADSPPARPGTKPGEGPNANLPKAGQEI